MEGRRRFYERVIILIESDRFSDPNAVHSSGCDAAGIAGPFTAGIQSPKRGLEFFVPEDPNRRGRARFNAGKDRSRISKAVKLLIKEGQGGAESIRHIIGKTFIQTAGDYPGAVSRA